MKNIKIITRHTPSNYGSLLQSLATLKVIEKLGHECEIIDYRRVDERGAKAINAAINKKSDWNNNIVKKLIYFVLRYPFEFVAQKKFDKMRGKYLKLTDSCQTDSELKELKADIYLTGSDQVWGPMLSEAYDKNYFLSFVDKKAKKISFASSFGKTEFTPEIIKAYKQLLSNFDEIAVRENNAVDLLNSWGIPCKGQVLDPTLLLTKEDWFKLISKESNKKFVLVYQLHKNPNLDSYAKRFAKEVGLPLLRVSPSFHQVSREGKLIYLPELSEFLFHLKQCSYLITDSFHGTAFAINFNKQFIEVLPENKTGGRNLSILQLTGLTDRIVKDYSDFSFKDRIINYDGINKILQIEREKSIKILSDMINS